MKEWFECEQCNQLWHIELLTVNRCPNCGSEFLKGVVLKDRDVSPVYSYTAKSLDLPEQRNWKEWTKET